MDWREPRGRVGPSGTKAQKCMTYYRAKHKFLEGLEISGRASQEGVQAESEAGIAW